MKAESVINTRLSTFAGVTAIVGTTPARIYPMVLPQPAVFPAITYKRVESERTEGVYSDPGMVKARIQVICWDTTYNGGKALAEQVRLALERYGSAVSGTPIAGVTVYDIHMGSELDVFDQQILAYSIATDFTVVHAE